MDPIIYDLWEEFIQYGYNIRLKAKDGKLAWDSVKVLIPDLKIEWIEKSKTFYTMLGSLGVNLSESPEEAKMSKDKWERHHYLLQHGRIVHTNPNEKATLVRLLQIAYNIGQFKRELEKELYTPEQLKFYINNDLNKVTTYIEKISKLPEDIIRKLKEIFALNLKGGYTPLYQQYFNEYINYLKNI